MRRRLHRSAGHIFSAPEWRVVPPAAHSFLSCQKRMGRKEALGTRNRADAPEKAFCFCVPFTDGASRKERPSGGRLIGFPERTIHSASRFIYAR